MIECPNCGRQVDESEPLCTNCGYDIHSGQADEVRELREEGEIHPGRLSEAQRDDSGPATEEGIPLPSSEADEREDLPEQFDAGL